MTAFLTDACPVCLNIEWISIVSTDRNGALHGRPTGIFECSMKSNAILLGYSGIHVDI